MIAWYMLAGACTGFLVGLTGVGGGAIMTPILLLVFKLSPVTAIATDLWFATITKLSAATIHCKHQNVDWFIVKFLWIGSLPTALATTFFINSHLVNNHQRTILIPAIASIILLTSVSLIYSAFANHSPSEKTSPVMNIKKRKVLTVVAGIILGFIVALTSIGAGAIGTVFLLYLYRDRLTISGLVGTDIVHAIPLALLAGTSYFFAGNIDTHLLFYLLLGSIPGAFLGSLCTFKLPPRFIKLSLSSILLFSGLKLLG